VRKPPPGRCHLDEHSFQRVGAERSFQSPPYSAGPRSLPNSSAAKGLLKRFRLACTTETQ